MLQSSQPPINPLFAPFYSLDRPNTSLQMIKAQLQAIQLNEKTVGPYEVPDDRRPYGRNVLLASDNLEVMVATWTRAYHCAPHDHGGSVGAVKVLKGRSLHRVWRVCDGTLTLVDEELIQAGQTILARTELIHSMGDGGGTEPLVTLHVYAGPVTRMVVYDRARAQTCVVHGGCGAWLPFDQPKLIQATHSGFLPASAV